MSESQTALMFYLKFANINFPRVRKGRRMENSSVRVKTWGVLLFFTLTSLNFFVSCHLGRLQVLFKYTRPRMSRFRKISVYSLPL